MKMAVNTAKLLKNVPLPDEITTVHDNAVVIDTGGGTIKAGFSGDDCPRIIVPTCAGTQRGKHDSKETFVCTQVWNYCLYVGSRVPERLVRFRPLLVVFTWDE